MPRIPIVGQSIDAPISAPAPRASGVQVADGLGAGLKDISKSLGDLGEALGWQQDQDAKVWAANSLSRAHIDADQQFQTMKEKAGPAATNFTPDFLAWQDKYNGQLLQNAPNEKARTYLSQHLNSLRSDYGQKALGFEAVARQDWRIGQMDDAIDNTASSIYNNPTKDNFLQLYAQQKAVVDALEIEPQKKVELNNKLKESAYQGYWLGRIHQDPQGALDDLRKGVAIPGVPNADSFVAPPTNAAVDKYGATIDANAGQYGVDANFMRAQLAAESGGNAGALNTSARNGQPSIGIAQFQPDTAKRYNIDPNVPEQAIQGQAAYMSDLLKQFGGDYQKAAAAYNWGEGNVQKAVDQYGDRWLDAAPSETKNYVNKIFSSLGQPTQMLPGQIQPEHIGKGGDTILDSTPFKLRVTMMQHAESEVNKQTAIGKAQLVQDLRDANASLLSTGTYPNLPKMTRDRFIKYLGPEEGQHAYDDFQNTVKTGQTIQAFNTMPAADISANIQAAMPKPGVTVTPEQEANFLRLQEAGSNVIKARQEDPIGFGMKVGVVSSDALNFSDPAKFSGQLAQRAAVAKTMSQSYGTPLAVFTKNEAQGLAANLSTMTPDAQLGLFKSIRDGVGDPQTYKLAVQQIRPDSPVTAMAGALVGLDASAVVKQHWFSRNDTVSAAQAARYMLQGEELLNPNKVEKATDGKGKVIPMPPDDAKGTGLRPTFDDYAGDALRNQPQSADVAYQATRAVYAALSAEEGDYTGTLNTDRADKAIKMVFGGMAEHNGKKIIPPYGMDESSFLDLAKTKFDAVRDANKFDPNAVNWGNVALENAGDMGRYYVQIGAGYLLGHDNRPLIVDVNTPKNPPAVPVR